MTAHDRSLGSGSMLRAAILLAGLALAASFTVSVIAYSMGEDPTLLFRDLAVVVGADPLLGAMSALGVMLWTTAAAVSFFVAAVMRVWRRRDFMRFGLSFGILSAMLAIDDQFMIHEDLVERVWEAGQPLYVVVYGGALLAFIVSQWSLIRDRTLPLLAAAAVFLGGSVLLDQAADLFGGTSGVLGLGEDVLKFTGIVLWCAYGLVRAFGFVISPGPGESVAAEPEKGSVPVSAG